MSTTANVNLALARQVMTEVESYITRNGGGYGGWYAGIATDPRARLFRDHGVDEKNGAWICRDCGTDATARYVEDYFLRKGCAGDSGGGDSSTKHFYACRMTRTTNP